MSLSIHHVAFDCKDARLQSDFWSQVLGYAKENWGEEYGAMVYSLDNTGVRVIFMPVPEQKSVKNRVHLDVRTADGTREAEVSDWWTLERKRLKPRAPAPICGRQPGPSCTTPRELSFAFRGSR